jgi:LysM repeat protein
MRHFKWFMLFVVVLSFVLAPTALAAPAPQYAQNGYWYQVRWGDTLSSISYYSGVSAWAIAQANGLANPHYIYAGQWLWIPCQTPQPYPPPPPSSPAACGYWYPVRFGQTLSGIAAQTGVSAYAIAAANGLANPNLIYAGMSLWIPCPAYAPAPMPYASYQPMPTPY